MCISGECLVRISSGDNTCDIRVDSLRIGSKVKLFYPENQDGIVTHISRTLLHPKSELVEFSSGLLLTSWHPVFMDTEWRYPKECLKNGNFKSSGPSSNYSSRYVYSISIVLETNPCQTSYGIFVNSIPVITLGHGVINDKVLSHPYYGTCKVLDDLDRVEAWRAAKKIPFEEFALGESPWFCRISLNGQMSLVCIE